MTEPRRFETFELQTEPVYIGDAVYTLKEASIGAATKYRNALLDCATIGPDGKPSKFSGMADVEPLLVSLCLFDSEGSPVPLDAINRWPSRIVKQLFDRVKDISDLDETEENPLGNERPPIRTMHGFV